MWPCSVTLPSHLCPFRRERNAVSWGCKFSQSVLAANEVGNAASACLIHAPGVSFPVWEQHWGLMFGPSGGWFHSSALPPSHGAAPGGRAGWQGTWILSPPLSPASLHSFKGPPQVCNTAVPQNSSSCALLLPWQRVTEHPWCTRWLLTNGLGKAAARQLSGVFAAGTEQTVKQLHRVLGQKMKPCCPAAQGRQSPARALHRGAWRSCVPPHRGDPAATALLLQPCC